MLLTKNRLIMDRFVAASVFTDAADINVFALFLAACVNLAGSEQQKTSGK